jgi:hypothetical protein
LSTGFSDETFKGTGRILPIGKMESREVCRPGALTGRLIYPFPFTTFARLKKWCASRMITATKVREMKMPALTANTSFVL